MAKKPTKKPVRKKKKSLASKIAKIAKSQEQTIVEKVMNERNLVVAPLPEMSGTFAFVKETQHGKVRIEGEVTPEKLKLAEQFDAIFQEASGEIMDLAAYIPDDGVMNFLRSSGLTQKQIDELKTLKPWSVVNIAGKSLMKTPDNMLETVQDYVYRLEKAVLNQIKLRKDMEEKLTREINILRDLNLIPGLQPPPLSFKWLYVRVKAFFIKILS